MNDAAAIEAPLLAELDRLGVAYARHDHEPLFTVEDSQASTLLGLIDALDDNDDVQTVSANYDIAEETLARLTA